MITVYARQTFAFILFRASIGYFSLVTSLDGLFIGSVFNTILFKVWIV